MKSLLKVAVAGIVCVGLWSAAAQAQPVVGQPVPGKLNVQGVLRNALGEPVTGSYTVTFTLFDAVSGGNVLYAEPPMNMTLVGGVFNTYISAPSSVFINRSVAYLQVQVNADAPLPRTEVTSVGFAYQAEHAEVADAAGDLACTDCVAASEVQFNYAGSTSEGGCATCANGVTCTGCVTSTNIADGTITGADVSPSFGFTTTGNITTTGTVTAGAFSSTGTSTLSTVNGNIIYPSYVQWASNPLVGLMGDDFAAETFNNILSGGVMRIGGGANGVCGTVEMYGGACGSARIFTVNGEVRANVLKDLNNAAFYVDPNGKNVVNELYVSATASETATYFNKAGANRISGGTLSFDGTWTDINNGAYYLDPSATSSYNDLLSNGIRFGGWFNSGNFTSAGLGMNGGNLYMGPQDNVGHYVIMRDGAANRFLFSVDGTVNATNPSLRTNGTWLTLSAGSTATNVGGTGVSGPELLLQWDQADATSTKTIVKGDFWASRMVDRQSGSCIVDPNGTSNLITGSFTTLGTTYLNVASQIAATGFNLQANGIIQPSANVQGTLGTINRYFRSLYVQNVYYYSSRDRKRDINYLDEDGFAKLGDFLHNLKPATYFYKVEYEPTGGADDDLTLARTVPHYGLILDEMPAFLRAGGGWSQNDSMGFLLVAAKYHEDQIRALNRQIGDLEDRIALLEQALVDGGLIK